MDGSKIYIKLTVRTIESSSVQWVRSKVDDPKWSQWAKVDGPSKSERPWAKVDGHLYKNGPSKMNDLHHISYMIWLILNVVRSSLRNDFNPYPWIFGTVTECVFWKKNPESSLVTSQLRLRKWKWYVQIVSVRPSYDANFKWHMPICVERCRAEQKYMPFFGTVTKRAFRKKNPKHRNIYKWCNATLWVFPRNALGDDFFRIHG